MIFGLNKKKFVKIKDVVGFIKWKVFGVNYYLNLILKSCDECWYIDGF